MKQEHSAGGEPFEVGAALSGCHRWRSAWGRGEDWHARRGGVQTGLGPLVGGALKNRERAGKDSFWGLVGGVP